MANLNEGMTDDIKTPDESLVENENGPSFAKPPESDNNAPDVTLVVSTTPTDSEAEQSPTSKDLFGTQPTPNEIPNINAKIKLVEDGHAKVLDLKDIEASLLGKQTVSQEDAKYLDQFCKDLLTQYSLKEFSVLPSRTHHNTLLRHAQEALEEAETETMQSMVSSVDTFCTSVQEFHEYFEHKAMPFIENQLKIIDESYEDVMEKALTSPDTVVATLPTQDQKTQFINITTYPIYTFDHKLTTPDIYKDGVYKTVQFLSGMCSLKPAIMAPEILHFMAPESYNDEKVEESLLPSAVMVYKSKMEEVTLRDIFTFYLGETAQDRLEILEEMLDNIVEKTTALREVWESQSTASPINGEHYQTSQDFFAKHTADVQQMMSLVGYCNEVAHHLMQMNNAMVDIMPLITILI